MIGRIVTVLAWLALAGFVLAVTVGPMVLIIGVGGALGLLASRWLPRKPDRDRDAS